MGVEALAEAREAKLVEWFGNDRRWRITEEMTGERTAEGVRIVYQAGHFTIDPPGKFTTPLGASGRSGYVLSEVGPDGSDTGVQAAFGATALRKAQERFGCIINLPGDDGA